MNLLRTTFARWTALLLTAAAAFAAPPALAADSPDHSQSAPARGAEEWPWPPKADEPVNDRNLYRYLDLAGGEMVRAGTTLTNWDDLLEPRKLTLDLPKPSRRKLSGTELAHRLQQGVGVVGVFYDCTKCSNLHLGPASGFFLNRTGAFATCRHVLATYRRNGRGLVVLTRDGRACAVRGVLASDSDQDLIVLQVDGGPFSPLPLAHEQPAAGSPVGIVSHPEQHFYVYSSGTVARHAVQPRGKRLLRWMTVTADFAKGSSGAPVCNESGAVVGIVNNTESIYYTADKERQENLQMVLKNCTPVQCLLDLVKPSRQ